MRYILAKSFWKYYEKNILSQISKNKLNEFRSWSGAACKGNIQSFGGGNENILIHTDWFEKHYKNQGILEETLFHEASHTSLDSLHANKLAWIDAQNKDNNFISEYAKEFPNREDIAESYLLYFALKHKREILSDITIKKIENSIPNRIKYFENQNFEVYPF